MRGQHITLEGSSHACEDAIVAEVTTETEVTCEWCGDLGHTEYECDLDDNLSDDEWAMDGDYYFEIEWDLIKRLRSARGEFDA